MALELRLGMMSELGYLEMWKNYLIEILPILFFWCCAC
jgi:hypothetical protein